MADPPPGGLTPDPDADDLWLAAGEQLRRLGYADYEVSHFARDGDHSRYLCHTLHLQPVAAAGPGSVGTLPAAAANLYGAAGHSASGAVRCTHAAALDRYLAGPERGWGCTPEPVSVPDLLLEHFLHGFRLSAGIPSVSAWIDPSPHTLLAALWERWQRRGLAHRRGRRLALTARGRLQLDGLLAAAGDHLDQLSRRGARLAAAWPDGAGARSG